jgi:SAM-dependent methyltransferase
MSASTRNDADQRLLAGRSCAVCGRPFAAPVLRSTGSSSLTSLCTLVPQRTVVDQCTYCAHLQTPSMDDLDDYYSSSYRILIESEEEDQIYAVVDGEPRYRSQHQAEVLLDTLALADGARVLDYGAAKGATMRLVGERRPDVVAHFFDVSDMYVDFWRSFVPAEQFATYELPPSWLGSFDAVVSFFMLEHVAAPAEVVGAMAATLAPGGVLYAIVPNPFTNIADVVVVDHVNHFTRPSLALLLESAGLTNVEIDEAGHDGAWIATARRPAASDGADPDVLPSPDADEVAAALSAGSELAAYWAGVAAHIGGVEAAVAGRPAAVYGAGFYGAFIRSNLARPEAIVVYVDQNPFLQGGVHLERQVVAPENLPADVHDVYVGLNPRVARSAVEGITVWADRELRFHYL